MSGRSTVEGGRVTPPVLRLSACLCISRVVGGALSLDFHRLPFQAVFPWCPTGEDKGSVRSQGKQNSHGQRPALESHRYRHAPTVQRKSGVESRLLSGKLLDVAAANQNLSYVHT
ncbi:unnamed protein product, partial [Ectocarpus fasciculatus]